MLHHDRFNSANIHSFAVDRLSFPPITLNKITIFHTFIRLVDEINVLSRRLAEAESRLKNEVSRSSTQEIINQTCV